MLWLILICWCDNTNWSKSLEIMLKLCIYIVSLCWKTLVASFKMCWNVFYIHWIYFKLIQMLSWNIKNNCINTTHIFNINLIYESCKHIYTMPKGGIYNFVITNLNITIFKCRLSNVLHWPRLILATRQI